MVLAEQPPLIRKGIERREILGFERGRHCRGISFEEYLTPYSYYKMGFGLFAEFAR